MYCKWTVPCFRHKQYQFYFNISCIPIPNHLKSLLFVAHSTSNHYKWCSDTAWCSNHVCDFSPLCHLFSRSSNSVFSFLLSCLLSSSCLVVAGFLTRSNVSHFLLKKYFFITLCVSPNSVFFPNPCVFLFLSFWKRSELMSGHPFNRVSSSRCEKPPLAVPAYVCVFVCVCVCV